MIQWRLVEQTESHVIVFGFLGFFFSSSSWSVVTTGGGSGWSSSSVSFRVSQSVLDGFRTFKGVVSTNRQGQDVLVVVDNRVTNRWQGWVTHSQGDRGDGVDGGDKVSDQLVIGDVQDGRWEDSAIVVNLNNSHTIGEWRDVQHVQQRGFRWTNLGVGFDNLDVGNNFNSTSGNLGWDTQSLEERGLTWFHTGVTGWDPDVLWSNGTGLGWSSDDVGDNDVSEALQVTVGEDETDVTSDERQQLFVFRQLSQESSQGSSNHGVLTHQDLGFTTEGLSDFMHSLRRDVVDTDNEDGAVTCCSLMMSMKSSMVTFSSLINTSALCTLYSFNNPATIFSFKYLGGLMELTLTPPVDLYLTVMLGFSLLSRMPMDSSSFSRISRWSSPLVASSTIMIKSEVSATAMTCRPRPLPCEAAFMIPGKSTICTSAPLYCNIPPTEVNVVNS